MIVSFITSAICIGVIFLYGCVGEIIMEKSGHLNLGIPGIMCVGTAGGCFGVSLYMKGLDAEASPNLIALFFIAVFFAFIFAAALGAIYGFLTVSLRANQNITGLAVTTFGSGFAQFFMDKFVDTSGLSKAASCFKKGLPFADSLGWFGEIFLSHGILVYFAIAIWRRHGFSAGPGKGCIFARSAKIPPRRTRSASTSTLINTPLFSSAAALRGWAACSMS